MSFGQPSGPPANRSQIATLLELLERARHSDFRDARGPLGFTQRQANGKFTVAEATAFIETLEAELDGEGAPADAPPVKSTTPAIKAKRGEPAAAKADRAATTVKTKPATKMTMSQVLRKAKDQDLAAELQRRGWVVLEP